MTKITTLDIEGMHCSSCALLIEKSLKKLPGIENAHVNFASSQAMVKSEENIDPNVLIQQVKKSGYSASIKVEHANEQKKRTKEIKIRKNRLLSAGIFSIPMILFMVYDFFPGKIVGEKIIMPRMGIVSLLLTAGIFVIGREFFQGARSALKMKTFNMYSLIAIGTGVAFLFSVYNLILFIGYIGSFLGLDGMMIPNLYFEVAGLLITFVILGKYLEAKAK
ncbi:TPA: hypothetical protein DEP21_05845 [Patescibacteria group bacterium]|nr:hypothetical protein [Candidatus Gracilibacteria bacterium]